MKHSLLLFCFLVSSVNLWAQGASEVFNSSKVVVEFVGLDFSHVKLVGEEGFNNPEKIKNYYFGALNGLLMSEMEKYDVKRAFMRQDMDYALDVTERVNDEIDFIDLVTNRTPKSFSDETLQGIISAYDLSETEADYGLSFVVHSLNKFQEQAYIYVVLFDTKSKEILFSDKLSGEAGGFGFRNYWARSVYNIIKDIQKQKYRRWRKDSK